MRLKFKRFSWRGHLFQHALKPNPKTHIQEAWRIMDFFSHIPESCHKFTFLFDDLGIPSDFRHMEGFGVHTFKLINREDMAGKSHKKLLIKK